jgi:hypothetical protein
MIEADAGTGRQVATVIIVGANSKIIPQLCNALILMSVLNLEHQ